MILNPKNYRKSHTFSLTHRKGQVALILILLSAIALIFMAVTLNLGKIAIEKNQTLVASNTSASLMGSYWASYAQSVWKTQLDSPLDLTSEKRTSVLRALITMVLLVAAALILPVAAPITAGLWVAAGIMAFTSIFSATVTQPAVVGLLNKMFAAMAVEDQFLERGIMQGLQSSVTDSTAVVDVWDLDNDGYTDLDNDKTGRFSYYYVKKRMQNAAPRIADSCEIQKFLEELGQFLYRGYWKQSGQDCTGNLTFEQDDWGIWDPVSCDQAPTHVCCSETTPSYQFPTEPLRNSAGCSSWFPIIDGSVNPRRTFGIKPLDHPCCNWSETAPCVGNVPPAYCNPDCLGSVVYASSSITESCRKCPDTAANPPDGRKCVYDPYYEDYINEASPGTPGYSAPRFSSFKERLGHDDENISLIGDYHPNPDLTHPQTVDTYPPICDSLRYRCNSVDPPVLINSNLPGFFRSEDSRGKLFRVLWQLSRVELDQVSDSNIRLNPEWCYWCDNSYSTACRNFNVKNTPPPGEKEHLDLPNSCSGLSCCVTNVSPGQVDNTRMDAVRNASEILLENMCSFNSSGLPQGLWKKGADRFCSFRYPYDEKCPGKNCPEDCPSQCTDYSLADDKQGPPIKESTHCGDYYICDCDSPTNDGSCSISGFDGDISTPATDSFPATPPKNWHDDPLDDIVYNLNAFIKWAQDTLDSDKLVLASTMKQWYPEAKAWIAYDSTRSVCGQAGGNLTQWACTLTRIREVLLAWRTTEYDPGCDGTKCYERRALVYPGWAGNPTANNQCYSDYAIYNLDRMISYTIPARQQYPPYVNGCSLDINHLTNPMLPYMCSPLSDPSGALVQTVASPDNPSFLLGDENYTDWGINRVTIPRVINCLDWWSTASQDPFLFNPPYRPINLSDNDREKFDFRSDFLKGLYDDIDVLANELQRDIDKLTEFLTRVNDILKPQWQHLNDTAPPALGDKAIYGWKDKDSGRWHIVKSEARGPLRCHGNCGRPGSVEPNVPEVMVSQNWAKTTTYFSLVDYDRKPGCSSEEDWRDRTKCFKGGTVKSRVIRWDEPRISRGLTFANGMKIWNFVTGRPSLSNLPLIIQQLENVCDADGSDAGDGAFILNGWNGASLDHPADPPGCEAIVNQLLPTGIKSETCAEYFYHTNIIDYLFNRWGSEVSPHSGFMVKFAPCGETF